MSTLPVIASGIAGTWTIAPGSHQLATLPRNASSRLVSSML